MFRFGDQNRSPDFSDSFANEGLRDGNENTPNLKNRGRFNPSRPRSQPLPDISIREPRQENVGGI